MLLKVKVDCKSRDPLEPAARHGSPQVPRKLKLTSSYVVAPLSFLANTLNEAPQHSEARDEATEQELRAKGRCDGMHLTGTCRLRVSEGKSAHSELEKPLFGKSTARASCYAAIASHFPILSFGSLTALLSTDTGGLSRLRYLPTSRLEQTTQYYILEAIGHPLSACRQFLCLHSSVLAFLSSSNVFSR